MFYFLHLREQATRLKHDVSATRCPHYPMQMKVYSYFEKGCRKKCARDNLDQKGNIGYYQYTVLTTVAVESSFVAFLSTRRHMSTAFRASSFKFL